MDKLLRYFPHFLVFSYLIRILKTGAELGDALVILVFGCLVALQTYLDHIKEPEANTELKTRLRSLEESTENIKSKVSSLSVAHGIRK